ncbi:MAG: M28 family peptidase [Verrucomicrobiales bacterium]
MRNAVLVLISSGLHMAHASEEQFLSEPRQLTFEGRRAGEGYFSADGKKMIFQSERDPANPFFQIFLLNLESGDVRQVSPGHGKTTCAWIHPSGDKVLFASTHEDLAAKNKQEQELKNRAEGKMRRYAWDYDENFDIFETRLEGSEPKNLTAARGYDAEGCYSPDGQTIVFASNRHAYAEPLAAGDARRLQDDKQYFMEIYTMRADGTQVLRLTSAPGYDGGPFFSADGRNICWRRFNDTGEKAEIWTMKADGAEQKQITHLGAMSWAPFFHPSGRYLVFATNLHGFDNFELYLVDAEGRRDPVRVTTTEGFDGLASFSPDGKTLTWTSNRTTDSTSQIFLAAWNHARALEALRLEPAGSHPAAPSDGAVSGQLTIAISPADLKTHISYLASDALEGRLAGTRGEILATEYAARMLERFGLGPAGENGSWFLSFDFTAGVELGPNNSLRAAGRSLRRDQEWRPLSFSAVGDVPAAGLVFAGYGIELPEEGKNAGYSSYFHLETRDRWVMVLRYVPEGLASEQRARLIHRSSLRYKAMTAREHGARGVIFVSGPNSKVREQLVPLGFDASLAGSGLAAISVTDAVADELLGAAGRTLQSLQDELDKGGPVPGFEVKGASLSAQIDLKQEKRTGRNVLARLSPEPIQGPETDAPPLPAVLIGAHIDHLGREFGGNSRATETERGRIHPGADDNASGVASLLEIAQWFASEKSAGKLSFKRDVIFAAWSGEEEGLLGSSAYAKSLGRHSTAKEDRLDGQLCAVLNMDMVGRLTKTLVLQGLGSSDAWKPIIEKRNAPLGLPLTLQSDCFAPTDTTTFYPKRVPILNAFTGSHEDYHRPTDTADKINHEGAAKVTQLIAAIARDLATSETSPVWKEYKSSDRQGQRAGMRVYLGTIPDYSQGDIVGVKLSGVSPVGPAAKAGLRGADIIVALGGKEIKNIYDYTYVLGELKVGAETEISVLRDGQKLPLKITPVSRD